MNSPGTVLFVGFPFSSLRNACLGTTFFFLSCRYILVGGKGGVGKTSMSAALATRFADNGQSTLIISTDPAHSLSDSFGVDLSGGTPTSVVGIDNLYAQEINPDEIKSQINLLSKEDKAAMMPGMMGEMGLDDLDNLFETLPPG